jgi:hypothetical protein
MNPDERPEADAAFRARLHALLGAGATTTRLEALYSEARRCLGAAHEVTLIIECHLDQHRCRALPADEAMALGADLWDRGRAALPADHPTLRAITSLFVGCLNRRGHAGDLDRVVALRRDELHRAHGDQGADWTGIARVQLGSALLERGRFGWLDPDVDQRDADKDIAAARELIEHELSRRSGVHGRDHPFTWQARTLRCGLLVALAQRARRQRSRAWAGEALVSADALAQYEWDRFGRHTVRALRAQLWRAEALLVLQRDRQAESEARLASVIARRYCGPEAGNALVVLAWALVGRDRQAALAAAEAALTARLAWFSADGYQVAEAQQLVDKLRTESPALLSRGSFARRPPGAKVARAHRPPLKAVR